MKFPVFILMLSMLVLYACSGSKKATTGRTSDATTKREYYSKKFGVELDRGSNMKLYAAVDNWIGVKYKYAQCSKAGVDCSGLVSALYTEVYQCKAARNTKALYEQIRKVDKDEIKEGDILFFKMKGRKIDHVGIYLSNKKFVHASTKQGVVVSNLEDAHFKKAFKTAGRLRCS